MVDLNDKVIKVVLETFIIFTDKGKFMENKRKRVLKTAKEVNKFLGQKNDVLSLKGLFNKPKVFSFSPRF